MKTQCWNKEKGCWEIIQDQCQIQAKQSRSPFAFTAVTEKWVIECNYCHPG